MTEFIDQMTPEELEAIGTRIYGHWGWPVKLGKLVGKDASTLRRWRLGQVPIDPKSAIKIREIASREEHSYPDSAETDAMRILRLMARYQTKRPNSDIKLSLHCDPNSSRLSLICSLPGRATLTATDNGRGDFIGLSEIIESIHLKS
jgi:hypothetical protein